MKVIIIGGGVSGLMCALNAKSNDNEVIIIDKNNVMGKKIAVTGNGKCNFYNLDIIKDKYNTHNYEILESILNNKDVNNILPFLNSIGIDYTNKDNLLYPLSNTAVSVQNALILACKKRDVVFINNCIVNNIIKENNIFKVITNDGDYICDKVVLSVGGNSYTKFGSSGDAIKLLNSFNVKYYNYLPALTSLKGGKTFKWEGIRINACLKHLEDDVFINEESGEVQLTKDGISGICVFNLSSKIIRGLNNNKKEKIIINFMPMIKDDFKTWYFSRCNILKDYTVIETLESLINYKLLYAIIPSLLDKKNDALLDSELLFLENTLTKYEFNVSGYGDFDSSQVSSGGISLDEIKNDFMLKNVNNIYVIGEALDVDGICGGFNMGFAFISGYICGKAIKDE